MFKLTLYTRCLNILCTYYKMDYAKLLCLLNNEYIGFALIKAKRLKVDMKLKTYSKTCVILV